MDKLSLLSRPVEKELAQYKALFGDALAHEDDFLGTALRYVRQRQGKMMRPILVLLMAREVGKIGEKSLRSAVALELLHTASLVHDDVVDESGERRGQRSVNAVYDNKVAVLLGDYLLSTTLLQAAVTQDIRIVEIISRLGGTLSEGEMSQLAQARTQGVTEEAYFRIIDHKTAALFAACAELGALSAGGSADYVAKARRTGEIMGLCFQIKDDLFDYYAESRVGKPTGNDMREGKLTLPAIYALRNTDRDDVREWAARVKLGVATEAEIQQLVDYTKQSGGMEYARSHMEKLRGEARELLSEWKNADVRESLYAYMDYIVERER